MNLLSLNMYVIAAIAIPTVSTLKMLANSWKRVEISMNFYSDQLIHGEFDIHDGSYSISRP